MKKLMRFVGPVCLLIGSSAVHADPGLFLGAVYTFGDNAGPGLSLKVLSTNRENRAAVGAGVTYYPMAGNQPLGLDASVGYLFDHAAITAGWDFMHSPQLGVGYVNTQGKPTASRPAPPPAE